MEENEDDKLKELKSDIVKFDRNTKKLMQKKWEKSTGKKWEGRWTYWKRAPLVWILIAVWGFVNVFGLTQLAPYFVDNLVVFLGLLYGSWIAMIVVVIFLIKKYVYR